MASKFHNKREIVDGISFASRKEAERYRQLKLLLRAGEIHGLELQPRFPMTVSGVKVCTYVSDFAYIEDDGNRVTEDVKGVRTKDYVIKRKLFLALYPEIEHREV